MAGQRPTRRTAIAAGLAAVLIAAGCGRGPAPEPPRSAGTGPPSTIARAEIGGRLTVTAAVDRLVDDGAFVVRDADLTDGALLVLTTTRTQASPPELVTLDGVVILFAYDGLAARYGLRAPEPYRAFEGQRALAADQVTVWR